MALFTTITFPLDPPWSHIQRILLLPSSVPQSLPTVWCYTQLIRMLWSSVLTFLPVFACYLIFRRSNRSLQPQSCSVRCPRHREWIPIIHCYVNYHFLPTRLTLPRKFAWHVRLFWSIYLSLPVPCLFVISIVR